MLTDDEWDVLKGVLDHVRLRRRRRLKDERRPVEGVVWRCRNGVRRSVLAELYSAPGTRAAHLHIRRPSSASGSASQDTYLYDTGRAALAEAMLDGIVVCVNKKAPGAMRILYPGVGCCTCTRPL